MEDVQFAIWRTYYALHVVPHIRSRGIATATPVGSWGFGRPTTFLFERSPRGVKPIGELWIEYPDEDADLLLEGGVSGIARNWAVSRCVVEKGTVRDKVEEVFLANSVSRSSRWFSERIA